MTIENSHHFENSVHVPVYVLNSLTLTVWRVAVVDTDRDPAVLAAACEAVLDRIGRQLLTMGTDEAHNLVCCHSLCTPRTNLLRAV